MKRLNEVILMLFGEKEADSESLSVTDRMRFVRLKCFVTDLDDEYVYCVSIPPAMFSCFASLSFSLHLSFFTEDSVVQTPTKAAKARRFLLPFVLCSHDSPPKGTCCSCVCVCVFNTNPHLLSTCSVVSSVSHRFTGVS